VKKELFPIVGLDGIARALFHYHLLELKAAGIGEICIIVQPGEELLVRAYLQGPDEGYLRRLEKHPALLREAEQMRDLAGQITFAVQSRQEATAMRLPDQGVRWRRHGPALPRRPFVPRQGGFAVPRAGANGGPVPMAAASPP